MKNRNIMLELHNAITWSHTGKMSGIVSLSTSCLENPTCQARRERGNTICYRCYAYRELRRKKNLREKMKRNTDFLTTTTLSDNDIPFINATCFRFESFGEIKNTIQVRNYFTIAKMNEQCIFTLWTKNLAIVKHAMDDFNLEKPGNLIIVASSPRVNQVYKYAWRYEFVDKIFTVYDKKTAAADGIRINCGKRKCTDCLLCYSHNEEKYINELVK